MLMVMALDFFLLQEKTPSAGFLVKTDGNVALEVKQFCFALLGGFGYGVFSVDGMSTGCMSLLGRAWGARLMG